jgi:hypothetical protein
VLSLKHRHRYTNRKSGWTSRPQKTTISKKISSDGHWITGHMGGCTVLLEEPVFLPMTWILKSARICPIYVSEIIAPDTKIWTITVFLLYWQHTIPQLCHVKAPCILCICLGVSADQYMLFCILTWPLISSAKDISKALTLPVYTASQNQLQNRTVSTNTGVFTHFYICVVSNEAISWLRVWIILIHRFP